VPVHQTVKRFTSFKFAGGLFSLAILGLVIYLVNSSDDSGFPVVVGPIVALVSQSVIVFSACLCGRLCGELLSWARLRKPSSRGRFPARA
jgi:hypothetical protein